MTVLGTVAMHLPLDLRLCRLILFGALFDCLCDAIVIAACLQGRDPFTWPTKKILKEDTKFVHSLKHSAGSRQGFDEGNYSEPIMLRNMAISWLGFASGKYFREGQETKHLFVSVFFFKGYKLVWWW